MLAVVAGLAIGACGSDDKTKKTKPAEDASAEGSVGGTAGTAGAGGQGAVSGTSGVGGTGGVAGMAGSSGASGAGGGPGGAAGAAGMDASVDAAPDAADAAMEAEAGLVCPSDGGGVDAASDAGDAGDASTVGGQWRDWDAGICRPCPASMLDCDSLLGPPAPTFDPATGLLVVHVAPGTAEVVSGALDYRYHVSTDAGQVVIDGPTTPVQVDKNELTVDLSAVVPPTVEEIGHGIFTLTDACGAVSDSSDNGDEFKVRLTPLDGGGTNVSIDCEIID